jgi:hypothetical protein
VQEETQHLQGSTELTSERAFRLLCELAPKLPAIISVPRLHRDESRGDSQPQVISILHDFTEHCGFSPRDIHASPGSQRREGADCAAFGQQAYFQFARVANSLERLVDDALVLDRFLMGTDTNTIDLAPMVKAADSGPVDASKMAGVAGRISFNRPVNGVSANDCVFFDLVVAATLGSDAGAFIGVPHGPSPRQVQSDVNH